MDLHGGKQGATDELLYAKRMVLGNGALQRISNIERRITRQSELLKHAKSSFTAASLTPFAVAHNSGSVVHVDPTKGDVSDEERAAMLLDVVQRLREECALLTQSLIESHRSTLFADLFVAGSEKGPRGLLAPPPLETMLSQFRAEQEQDDAKRQCEAQRQQVQRAVKQLHAEARWNMSHIAMDRLVAPPPMNTKRMFDPVEVCGLAAPASVNSDRAEQSIKETHALLLLTHVMHAASKINPLDMGPHGGGSRGSSETPSITPIASVIEGQSIIAHQAAVREATVGDFGGEGGVSASTIVGRSNVGAGPIVGGGGISTMSNVGQQKSAILSPVSSAFSPVPNNNKNAHGKSIQFADKTNASSTVVGTTFALDTTNRSGSGSTTKGSGTTSSNRALPKTPSTQHDTSTAATEGNSSPSAADSASRVDESKPPMAKQGWSSEESGAERGGGRASSQGSNASSTKKKSRGLFACIRRSDDTDEE